jgi:hypothetical protein
MSPRDLTFRQAEEVMLREFQRHYDRYSLKATAIRDDLEWLATMQHYGAPTRLLDWSWSEYIALFFAISESDVTASDTSENQCVVWAVNQTRCWDLFTRRLSTTDPEAYIRLRQNDKDSEALNAILRRECPVPTIAPLNPFRIDERRHMQQSTFLVPLAASQTFWANFSGTLGPGDYSQILVSLSPQMAHDALMELRRANTTPLTLFPGVEGLARSVWHVALLPELRPKKVPPPIYADDSSEGI